LPGLQLYQLIARREGFGLTAHLAEANTVQSWPIEAYRDDSSNTPRLKRKELLLNRTDLTVYSIAKNQAFNYSNRTSIQTGGCSAEMARFADSLLQGCSQKGNVSRTRRQTVGSKLGLWV
jgi:hypothetical protein